MIKRFFVFLFALVFSLSLFSPILAKTETVPQEVSSYELFWPVTAGKTLGDSLYGLKIFKEKLRGAFIFGKLQKLDYSLFLATKRVVEAEKLLNEGKVDLAKATLAKMDRVLDTASANIDIPKELKSKSEVDALNKRLDNLETFLKWLVTKNESVKADLGLLLTKVQGINNRI